MHPAPTFLHIEHVVFFLWFNLWSSRHQVHDQDPEEEEDGKGKRLLSQLSPGSPSQQYVYLW